MLKAEEYLESTGIFIQ